ncbi:hypothetical protein N7468_001384 [Penicillium chermesinum]|uniref:Uncharacterized protein n=1 Tax=Penicillium chermesinum TaxID=63820 RepID=A0A9W9PI90_9EURO|nr:uncharacterized protein N7468_001384 [Penicillium chermesinum]KAJ5246401.1 hypothetical protein N7468_001384 [Penicillium chermesinum]KAJ6144682.1 hypothetical protein N7470_008577 [Penicillium chermesinum]
MECFRQIFRCFKAPSKNNEPRAIEIGPPTNFRKEELPACFSDAESVVSPHHSNPERPILTKEPQCVDVASERASGDGKNRGNDRNGGSPTVPQVEGPKPGSQDELEPEQQPQDGAVRLRKRARLMKWLRPASVETQSADK